MRAMVYEAYTMSGTSQGWAVNMIRLQWRRTKTRERRVPVSSYPIPSCLCPCYVSCPITHVSVLCILCYHTCLCCVSCPTTRVSVLCILCYHTCVCAVYPMLSHVCLCCVSCPIIRVSVLCILSYHMYVCAVYPVPSHLCTFYVCVALHGRNPNQSGTGKQPVAVVTKLQKIRAAAGSDVQS